MKTHVIAATDAEKGTIMDRRKDDPIIMGIYDRLDSLEKVSNEVKDILDTVKGGLRILEMMGIVAKWLASIAAACALAWATIKYGVAEALRLPK